MRRFLLLALAVIPLAALTAACDDGIGLGEPFIARDTSVVISVPDAASEDFTAIDFSQMRLRRPERVEDATAWDFTLRRDGGSLRFVPNPFDIRTRRPLILRSTQAFDAIERAPTARSAYGDPAVVLQPNAVYVIRSRHYPTAGGGFCYGFSKMQVVALDPAAGTAEFSVHANVGCADDRLEID